MNSVDLGPSADFDADDGERESSCVAEAEDAPPSPARKVVRRDLALDALREAISEYGEKLPGSSTIPPGVRGVKLDQWKSRWILRTGYDASSGQSVRVNFDQDRRDLLATGEVGITKPCVWTNG